MRLVVDLCSGLGGFSQAFMDAKWNVIRIDNDPRFKEVPFTVMADVCDLEAIKKVVGNREVDVIVAGPPCERFSLGNRMFPKKGIKKALEIVGSVYEIIAEYRPKYWIVENPRGRLRWFLGKPNSTIRLCDYGGKYMKPTDLWHNLSFHIIEGQKPYEPSWSSTKNRGEGSTGLLRLRDPAKRAHLPIGLSQAILEGAEDEK